MGAPPADDRTWAPTRDEIVRRLRADTWNGVSEWFDRYAQAWLASDVALCERLVTESFELPDDVAELVRRRFSPGADVLRAGRSGDALDLLTADSGEIGPIVRAVAAATVTDDAPGEDLGRASANGLKGVWFEAIGRPTEAAAAYFEAATHVGEFAAGHDDASVQLLTRATTLDPGHALAHWHLADALRVRSNSSTPPFVDRSILERSLVVWERGAAARLPDPETSWAYVVRALISEQRARLDDASRASCWWEAVLYVERAILLDASDARRWAMLGRCQRLLTNERASLHATAKALECNPDEPSALEERAAILCDTGGFAEAGAAIERRLALAAGSEDSWALGVKAYILAHRQDYQAARGLIDKVLAAERDSIWDLDLKATCCWMLGDRTGAREAYETIYGIGLARPLGSDDRRSWAFAAYRLGRIDESIQALEALSNDPLLRDGVSRLLGLCYYAKGESGRGEASILSRIIYANARELDDFLLLEFPDLESRLGQAPPRREEAASLARVRTIAAALADRARTTAGDVRAAAQDELAQDFGARDRAGSTDPIAITAARAGVARLQLEGGQWRGAAVTFLTLQQTNGLFPEATAGVTRAVEGVRADARRLAAGRQWPAALECFRELVAVESEVGRGGRAAAHQELGDTLWTAGFDDEALAQFEEALAHVAAHEGARRADLNGRVGFARHRKGEVDGARKSYQDALRLYRETGHAAPGRALADACRPLLRGAHDFWTIDAQWRTLANDAGVDGAIRSDFARAVEAIATYLDDVYRLSEPLPAESAMPFVTPIVLEVGTALVPLVDPASDRSEKGKFLNEDIPAMRERIHRSMGLRNMPGILVRPQPAGTEQYAILLEGAPVATGSVRANSRFFVEPLNPESSSATHGAHEAVDPSSGRLGRWFPSAELKSETEFILSHVETVLRQRLDMFLGVDQVRALLAEIKNEERGAAAAPASSLHDDSGSLDALARALRALVRESVPITDWSNITAALADRRPNAIDDKDAVREIRLRLKAQLPGNQEGTACIQVPEEWERADSDAAGIGLIDASPELAHRRLVSIRQWLEAPSGRVAIVTRTADLRPLVRRLIEFEFPTVPVLSLEEVVAPERIVLAAETGQVAADR